VKAWLEHLVAGFVLLHVVAVLVLALPSPGRGLQREAWKDPTVQQEFVTWSERLVSMGWGISPDELEEQAWNVATGWASVREGLTRPFWPYVRYVGVRQPWRMFVAPHRHPSRLHVEVRIEGQWVPVYVERSPEDDWQARRLDHDRFRAALFRYGWPGYGKPYRQLGEWLAARAAEDFPAATALRTRMYKFRTLTPEEVRRGALPEGKFERKRVYDLEALR
jgi:hypothetical protein